MTSSLTASIYLSLVTALIAIAVPTITVAGESNSCSDPTAIKFKVTDYSKTFTHQSIPFSFKVPNNFRLVKYSSSDSVYVLNPSQYEMVKCDPSVRNDVSKVPLEEFYVAVHQIGDTTDIKEVVKKIVKAVYPHGLPEVDLEFILSRISKFDFGDNVSYMYETEDPIYDVPVSNILVIDKTENYAVVFTKIYSNNLDNEARRLGQIVYHHAVKSLLFKSHIPKMTLSQLTKDKANGILAYVGELPSLPARFQNGLVLANSGAYNIYLYILDEKIKPEDIGVFNSYLFDSNVPNLPSFSSKVQAKLQKYIKEGNVIEISTICRSVGTSSFC